MERGSDVAALSIGEADDVPSEPSQKAALPTRSIPVTVIQYFFVPLVYECLYEVFGVSGSAVMCLCLI